MRGKKSQWVLWQLSSLLVFLGTFCQSVLADDSVTSEIMLSERHHADAVWLRSIFTPGTWVFIGFGLAAMLLVLYFLCERAPCHWSPTTEAAYLSVVLVLVFAGCQITCVLKGMTAPVQQVRGLMQFVLFAYMFHRFLRVKNFSGLFAIPGCSRQEAKAKMSWKALKGKRARDEVEAVLEDAVELSNHQSSLISDEILGLAMYFLLMLESVAWVASSEQSIVIDVCVVLVEVSFIVAILIPAFERYRRLRPILEHLRKVVEGLVDTQDGTALQYVLASVNVCDLVAVAKPETIDLLVERALDKSLLSTIS